MIFVQKLPTLEPEMRDALRVHILRKRQRLKQELEQDAIEKRLKREKELKQLQDAMTLDQIKEQLTTLEKRLESLKEEKHSLFVQLKQVLNEDNTRRKQQNESDQQKQQCAETEKACTPLKTVPGDDLVSLADGDIAVEHDLTNRPNVTLNTKARQELNFIPSFRQQLLPMHSNTSVKLLSQPQAPNFSPRRDIPATHHLSSIASVSTYSLPHQLTTVPPVY